jgi:adenosylcobinamide-GDP ribazoletransferase
MINGLVKFIHAASYVTIVPLACLLPPAKEADHDQLHGLAKYLPFVGILIGAILAVLALLCQYLAVNHLLGAAIIAVLWLTITGGLHFDGLMDTADGIFSHRNRERMLEIMHDSRVGNFAVMVGIAAFVLKVVALAAINNQLLVPVVLLGPALARLAETWAIGFYPYAREDGKGKIWHDTTVFPRDLIFASSAPLALVLVLVLAQKSLLIPLAAYYAIAIVTGLLVAAYLNKRVQGHTGDTYGAVVEATETLSLVIFAALFSRY